MQIIFNSEEITLLYEALLTETIEWEDDKKISEQKGHDGKFELDQIKLLEALRKRLAPYVK